MLMPLDTCCRKIAELLYQSGQPSPRTLARLVEKTGFARSTVLSHLQHLQSSLLLDKQEILQGMVGRPKVLYKPAAKLMEELGGTKSD